MLETFFLRISREEVVAIHPANALVCSPETCALSERSHDLEELHLFFLLFPAAFDRLRPHFYTAFYSFFDVRFERLLVNLCPHHGASCRKGCVVNGSVTKASKI